MTGTQAGTFDRPDETRAPNRMLVEVVRLGAVTTARITFQPGWRWSESVRPVVGTDSCQVRHVGTIVSGRLHVVHEDGSEVEAGPGWGLRHRARPRRLGGRHGGCRGLRVRERGGLRQGGGPSFERVSPRGHADGVATRIFRLPSGPRAVHNGSCPTRAWKRGASSHDVTGVVTLAVANCKGHTARQRRTDGEKEARIATPRLPVPTHRRSPRSTASMNGTSTTCVACGSAWLAESSPRWTRAGAALDLPGTSPPTSGPRSSPTPRPWTTSWSSWPSRVRAS